MATIRFENVTKRFGSKVAVDDLSFEIKDGEYVTFLGPSGCGKTTTLRMIAGLIDPTEGCIYWDDKPIEQVPPHKRHIGYCFQHYAIFPHLNVYENTIYGLNAIGHPSKNTIERGNAALKIVGLSGRENEWPKRLNAPDLQRLAIARVLAMGSKVLLLDEPLGALDLKVREEMQDELRDLVTKLNLTAIHVTHDQSEGMAIADRVICMRAGKLMQLDKPRSFLLSPKNPFTANFIGESDFLEGLIVAGKESGPGFIEIYGGPSLAIKSLPGGVGEAAIVSMRREFMRIEDREKSIGENGILGKVQSDRLIGDYRRIYVELETGKTVQVKVSTGSEVFKMGQEVFVIFPSELINTYPYPEEGLNAAISVQ
jgi:ABC-type Fe3+/spermidine/putrescine transport system ATPase subunit